MGHCVFLDVLLVEPGTCCDSRMSNVISEPFQNWKDAVVDLKSICLGSGVQCLGKDDRQGNKDYHLLSNMN